MSVSLSPIFNGWQGFSIGGLPLAGGLLNTYIAGTSTPAATYTDSSGATPNANPIQLDSAGLPPNEIWLTDGVSYKFILTDSLGLNPRTYDNISGSGAVSLSVLALLANTSNVAQGDALIGVKRTASGAIATTQHARNEKMVLHAQADFGAVGDGTTDDTAALQAWATACASSNIQGQLGGGNFKITTAITLASGGYISGNGPADSVVLAYGCDGFTITGAFAGIERMQIRSLTAPGVADPKTNKGINCNGTTGSHRDDMILRDLYLRGWLYCIDAQYVWSSVFDNIETINCTYSIRLFGQAVNNSISNSRLVANTGTASIITTINSGDRGEGLMVANTLLSLGTYGVISDGFLAMHFSNCITDLISDTGLKFTAGASAISYIGGWVYAANRGFSFDDLGGVQDLGNTIETYITTTAASSIGIYWGTNCKGLSLAGGEITAPNALNVYCIYINGSKVAFGPVLISDNSSAGHSVFVNTTNFSGINNLSGDLTITYFVSPVVTVASAAALTLPKTNDLDSFSITGTTNVTSIPAANWAGQTVKLAFTGALTFTNGSNLKLTGNFVTAAGSSIVLWCDGTNFYEIGRKA